MTNRIQDSLTLEAYRRTDAEMTKASALHRTRTRRAQVARKKLSADLTRAKAAGYGYNENPQFESAFGSIAFTYLQEKAPGLIPYVIGFQLLDRSEDGEKSVGAFVAEVGDQLIDVPMVYNRGELTGHHVMHLRKSDLFLPLREAFIDYLFSRNPQDLGEAGPSMNEVSPVRATPDIQPFSGSRFAKGAADLEHIRDFAVEYDMVDAYREMRTNPETLKLGIDLQQGKTGVHVDLRRFISASPQMLKTAAKLADAYPIFGEKMAKLYGDNWLLDAVENLPTAKPVTLRAPNTKVARLGSRPEPISLSGRLQRVPLDVVSSMGPSPAEHNPNQLYVKVATDRFDAMIREAKRYGDYIQDDRPLDKIAQAYKVESSCASMSPPRTMGMYKVVVSPEESKEMLVIPADCRTGTAGTSDFILDTSTKQWVQQTGSEYAAVSPSGADVDPTEDRGVQLFKEKKPTEGEVFLARTGCGKIYGPLLVKSKVGRKSMEVSDWSTELTESSNHAYPRSINAPGDIEKVFFVDDVSHQQPGLSEGTLVLAKGTKYLSLGKEERDEDGDYNSWASRKYRDDHKLYVLPPHKVNLHDLTKYANLQVTPRRGGFVQLGTREVREGDARRFLVGNLGISKEAAEDMINGPRIKQSYVVIPAGVEPTPKYLDKLAYNEYTPEFPNFQEPVSSESGRYQMESPEQYEQGGGLETPRQPLEPYEDVPGENVEMSQQELGAIEGEGGDEIFDMVGLVALLRNGRIDTTVRETTKALLQAINRLGRQILVFDVHDEEFIERYGDSNAENVRAALLSTFESVGDFFITLIRQSDVPEPELDLSQMPGV